MNYGKGFDADQLLLYTYTMPSRDDIHVQDSSKNGKRDDSMIVGDQNVTRVSSRYQS
jgi:hypothetical protein